MANERRPKTIESFIFTGVLKSEKQRLFDKQVTGIRGSHSARNRICREKLDSEQDVLLSEHITPCEATQGSIEERDRLTPNEEESLDEKYEKLGTTDIQIKLYRRECDKLGVIPIGAYMRNPCTSELLLKYYSMGADGAKALSIPLMLDSSLVRLDLEGNDIKVQGMAGIAEMLVESVTLKELNLSRNSLGHQGAYIVKNLLLKNRFIDSLYLAGNGFTDLDASTFADILKVNKTLKKLVLSNNSFGDESGVFFGNALTVNETLDHLDVSWNKFRGKSASQLCLSLRDNVGLKYMNIAYNGCGKDGGAAVAMVLGVNSTLQELDLTDNRLTDVEAIVIVNQLSNNETLKVLRLGDNLFTADGCLGILQRLIKAENSALEILDLKNTNVSKGFMEELKELSTSRSPTPVVLHGPCPAMGGCT